MNKMRYYAELLIGDFHPTGSLSKYILDARYSLDNMIRHCEEHLQRRKEYNGFRIIQVNGSRLFSDPSKVVYERIHKENGND